ncbi:hypothetical protein NA56DRAFT_296798 [Hyaloscypha hepaticicola]|uniref:Uncharacterized protein n=1 Tax=Hyaloscypha hepaticicola TaxID=2082293 RepID=A0A2J6QKM5_9HELO|nr:hypothetical protein NA56DRAFT_296798 [Hyaloscypha hepaticicola]
MCNESAKPMIYSLTLKASFSPNIFPWWCSCVDFKCKFKMPSVEPGILTCSYLYNITQSISLTALRDEGNDSQIHYLVAWEEGFDLSCHLIPEQFLYSWAFILSS